MKNIIYLLLFLCSFLGCENTPSKQSETLETINIHQNINSQKIEDFIGNIIIIPLQTTDSSLIGQVRKVKTNGKDWFISDQSDSPIKRFSYNGVFINEIGKRGQGPGEYIQITDFLINKDTVDIFAWTANKKWIHMQNNNTFLYQKDIKFPFSEVYPIKEHYLLQVDGGIIFHKENSSEKMNDYLYIVNKKFDLLKVAHHKKYPTDLNYAMVHNHFSPSFTKDEILYIREFNDTIYSITPSLDIIPKYRMNFGSIWYDQDFFEKYYNKNFIETHTEFNKRAYPKFITVNENADYIVLTYTRQENKTDIGYISFYDKTTKKSYNFKDEPHSVAGLFRNLQGYNGTYFYGYIRPEVFLDITSMLEDNPLYKNIKEIAKNITEDDNPLLILFETKK